KNGRCLYSGLSQSFVDPIDGSHGGRVNARLQSADRLLAHARVAGQLLLAPTCSPPTFDDLAREKDPQGCSSRPVSVGVARRQLRERHFFAHWFGQPVPTRRDPGVRPRILIANIFVGNGAPSSLRAACHGISSRKNPGGGRPFPPLHGTRP